MTPKGNPPARPRSLALALTLALGLAAAAASAQPAERTTAAAGGDPKRGEYLVKSVGCGDCHTPMKMGANGPEPDATRLLSGHPAEMQLPPPPAASGPWIASVAATMTAWAGPWGTSYTANLTPDPETGLGKWTEQQFVETLRTGRHLGRGREILPPMPWPALRNMTDQDLKSLYAYLRTLPAIRNKVPDPAPPAGAQK